MHPTTHAQSRPGHPAIIMAGSGETVTYGEMDAYADRFSQLMRARGLTRGNHVALLLENSVHNLQIAWGNQRAGTMAVPLSTRLTASECIYILNDSGADVLITSTHFAEVLSDIREACPELPVLIIGGSDQDSYEAALASQPAQPIADRLPGQIMLYSSGTTGYPKGIRPKPPEDDNILTPNPIVGLAIMGAGMPTDGSMVYLSPAPLYHAAPVAWCSAAHALGGTIVVMEKFDPEQALAAIERYRVTDSQWVPTHFVRMLKLDDAARTAHDLSSHQRALHAAAPCPVPVKQAMIEWWGPIINEYYAGSEGIGMTLVKAPEWLERPGTVGKAILGKLHVCGPDGEEVPAGTDGLVYFEYDRIPSYHNDPGKTAEAMHPEGWMTLGDIGHVDEAGYLFLTDRKSHMIISGGVNIYPQEIENLLVSHPRVMDAAVIGAPCPDLGERVVAVVQPVDMAAAGEALEQELRDYLAPQLSRVKMPRLFDFRPELPREANGKLYKRELRDEFARAAQAAG
ncbi:acyl-CoA synthetase [Qipengyuania marisflavi]|uniref:Acyl-CoA synthetase n=1 Tax=Qipengyuania marisflavi TaxID=2486356 RepID=A0A5S3PXJ6_9SPHN|nr:acyl-CoA synthetase [Qipengyuania marisflavi]TMM48325.1 acyl-CoA synthetase [Qipengyuania marisflavi]